MTDFRNPKPIAQKRVACEFWVEAETDKQGGFIISKPLASSGETEPGGDFTYSVTVSETPKGGGTCGVENVGFYNPITDLLIICNFF